MQRKKERSQSQGECARAPGGAIDPAIRPSALSRLYVDGWLSAVKKSQPPPAIRTRRPGTPRLLFACVCNFGGGGYECQDVGRVACDRLYRLRCPLPQHYSRDIERGAGISRFYRDHACRAARSSAPRSGGFRITHRSSLREATTTTPVEGDASRTAAIGND